MHDQQDTIHCGSGYVGDLFVTRQRKLYLPKTLVEPQVGMASRWGSTPIGFRWCLEDIVNMILSFPPVHKYRHQAGLWSPVGNITRRSPYMGGETWWGLEEEAESYSISDSKSWDQVCFETQNSPDFI